MSVGALTSRNRVEVLGANGSAVKGLCLVSVAGGGHDCLPWVGQCGGSEATLVSAVLLERSRST